MGFRRRKRAWRVGRVCPQASASRRVDNPARMVHKGAESFQRHFPAMLLAHPAALWCLLGLPVVLAIHFLQRRSRKEVVTTLFLLQQMRRESETGNRFERLRPSIPLWLQLLMVL